MPPNTSKSQEDSLYNDLRHAVQFIIDACNEGGAWACEERRERLARNFEIMETGDAILNLKKIKKNSEKFQAILNLISITIGLGTIPDYSAPNIQETLRDPQALFDWADALKCLLEANSDCKGQLTIVNTQNTLIILARGGCGQDFCFLNLDKRTSKMTFRFENGIGV